MNTSILGIKMLFLQQFNKIAVMDTIQIKDKRFTPFIPEERDSMTPALSNLRSAFTITDLVIPHTICHLAGNQDSLCTIKFF